MLTFYKMKKGSKKEKSFRNIDINCSKLDLVSQKKNPISLTMRIGMFKMGYS